MANQPGQALLKQSHAFTTKFQQYRVSEFSLQPNKRWGFIKRGAAEFCQVKNYLGDQEKTV